MQTEYGTDQVHISKYKSNIKLSFDKKKKKKKKGKYGKCSIIFKIYLMCIYTHALYCMYVKIYTV